MRSTAAAATLSSPSSEVRNPPESGRPAQKGGAAGVADPAANAATGGSIAARSKDAVETTADRNGRNRSLAKRTNPPWNTGLVDQKAAEHSRAGYATTAMTRDRSLLYAAAFARSTGVGMSGVLVGLYARGLVLSAR